MIKSVKFVYTILFSLWSVVELVRIKCIGASDHRKIGVFFFNLGRPTFLPDIKWTISSAVATPFPRILIRAIWPKCNWFDALVSQLIHII